MDEVHVDSVDTAPWVIVVSDGTRFIGRVSPDFWPHGLPASISLVKSDLVDAVRKGQPLILHPCYEYPIFADTTDKGFRKIPLPNTIDMMLDPCDIYLMQISRVVFLSDMSPDDRKLVEHMKGELLKSIARQKAARQGLMIVEK